MAVQKPPRDPYQIEHDDAQYVRETLGDSREAFAERLGVHPNTVTRWERGYGEPGWQVREAIFDLWTAHHRDRKRTQRLDAAIEAELGETTDPEHEPQP